MLFIVIIDYNFPLFLAVSSHLLLPWHIFILVIHWHLHQHMEPDNEIAEMKSEYQNSLFEYHVHAQCKLSSCKSLWYLKGLGVPHHFWLKWGEYKCSLIHQRYANVVSQVSHRVYVEHVW